MKQNTIPTREKVNLNKSAPFDFAAVRAMMYKKTSASMALTTKLLYILIENQADIQAMTINVVKVTLIASKLLLPT